jgi:hypothetical protein
MLTIQGIVFIPLALFFFFLRPRLLFPLLIVSAVFEASSVVSSGEFGIQPYYCVATLFVIRFLVFGTPVMRFANRSFTWLWISFVSISWISSLTFPFIFVGVPVIDPRIGMEEFILQGPTPLRFQLSNIVQPAFLTLNVLVLLASAKADLSVAKAHKAFMWSAYLIILIIFSQASCFLLGLQFPVKLLNNNPGYSIVLLNSEQLRPGGSFTEPSVAGAVLAALFAAFLWEHFRGKRSLLKSGVTLLACLLVASTSSLLAVIIVSLVLIFAYPAVRLPWFIRLDRLKRLSVFLISAVLFSALLFVPSLRAILLSQTQEKIGSHSALVRLGADAFSFNLVRQTYGLGVGLGSNRPSSFVAALLSQVGIGGFALFVFAAWKTLWPLRRDYRWIGMAALGLLLSMAFGVPDLSFSFLWILFALATQSNASDRTYQDLPRSSVKDAIESKTVRAT